MLFSKPHKQSPTPSSTAPNHVAIIMDGNGRWAKQQGKPRSYGHKKGADTLKNIISVCRESNIKYLTVYAFSSENWGRPEEEISDLMGLLKTYIGKELNLLIKNKIRLNVLGDISKMPKDVIEQINEAIQKTKHFDDAVFSIALSYGARQEITNALVKLCKKSQNNNLNINDISESDISAELYSHDLPDPDLLIRTGGEKRLSNFLLWQLAYTELYFSDTMWPDFSKQEFKQICDDFMTRERRYGTA